MLQYNSVLPYMLERMAPGQPLAKVSNQTAWASLLHSDTWEEARPRATLAASGALRKLIRFYISIEDGECTVERDLGELRALRRTHKTSDLRFLDDKVLIRLNGPQSSAAFTDAATGTDDGLTPFTRDCASLWRELRGAKGGHPNPAATLASSLKRKRKSIFSATYQGADILGLM